MQSVLNGGEDFQEFRQRNHDGFPHHVQIDIEVPVRNPVAHSAHRTPWNLGIQSGELRITIHHLGSCLANDDQAHDDRLLRTLVVDELFLAEAFDKDQRITRGQAHVLKIIAEPILSHTGRA